VGGQAVVAAGHSQGHLREEGRVVSAETSRESRLLAVKALASHPLFQLSTAGMELFHTNMLYWLATERPDESVAVWNAFGLSRARVDNQSPFIRREWRHIDLLVAPGDGLPALVLENKIGAIPNPQQLDGYYAGLRSTWVPFSIDAAEFVLLTLTPPSCVAPEPWRSITYRHLLPALQETAQKLTGVDAALIAAYADMIARLIDVAMAYDPGVDLNAPFALSSEEWSMLNDSRLLSLVEKVRAGRFAEIVTNKLMTAIGEVGQVGAGFSNGSAIYQWFMAGQAGRLFGWQVQNGAFRLAVILGDADPRLRADQEALVAKLHSPYFDFSLTDDLRHTLGRYEGRKQWLYYAPSFVYQYRPLAPGTTWNDLLALATWFSRRTLEFAVDHGAPNCI